MIDTEEYMTVFMAVFERMVRQGPGSPAATRHMFDQIPAGARIERILDVGCGKGVASLLLAQWSGGAVTAVDTHQPFLDHLAAEAARQELGNLNRPVKMSMMELDFPPASFDLLWAEGSAYILGVERAFVQWRPLLRPAGLLFLSDAVWTTDNPAAECRAFWESEYPQITDLETREAQARAAGYAVLASAVQPQADWNAFTADMETQVEWAEQAFGPSAAIDDLRREADMQRRFGDQVGYGGLLLQKTD